MGLPGCGAGLGSIIDKTCFQFANFTTSLKLQDREGGREGEGRVDSLIISISINPRFYHITKTLAYFHTFSLHIITFVISETIH